MTETTAPAPAPVTVEIVADRLGRPVALVPDTVAAALVGVARSRWVEVPGVNYGQGERTPAVGAVGAAAAAILAAAQAEPLCQRPERCGPSVAELAARGAFYGTIIGVDAWDREAGWYAGGRFERERHGRVCPFGAMHVERGTVHFAG